MFWIVAREKDGKLFRWGKSSGYSSRVLAEQDSQDCPEESFIGEGDTPREAYQNAKYEIVKRTGDSSVAYKNVRSK